MEDGNDECICPRRCDCECPEPEQGVTASRSNLCPVHNEHPLPDPDCPAVVHWDGRTWPSAVAAGHF